MERSMGKSSAPVSAHKEKLILSAVCLLVFLPVAYLLLNMGVEGFQAQMSEYAYVLLNPVPSLVVCTMLSGVLYLALLLLFNRWNPSAGVVPFVLFAALVGAALLIRLSMFGVSSRDYWLYLSRWVEQMRVCPGVTALSQNIGDYNMPYLYILFIITKLNLAPILLIKFVSVVFDCLLAYYVMKLVSFAGLRLSMQIASFCAVLLIPTVVLNSAFWGQCDAIYTALALGALYYGLQEQSRKCMAFIALAFSVKLQTIFFLPIILVLLLIKKIKWEDIWLFPVTFLTTLVPAIAAGRPVISTISIYFQQVGEHPGLVLNAPSVFQLMPEEPVGIFSIAGILAAGCAVLALLYYVWSKRELLDTKALLITAFLFCAIIPYLLPKMHDRYFYGADILSFVLLFYLPKRWFVPLGVVFSSFVSYIAYLGPKVIISQVFTALLLLVLIIVVLRDLVEHFRQRETVGNGETHFA